VFPETATAVFEIGTDSTLAARVDTLSSEATSKAVETIEFFIFTSCRFFDYFEGMNRLEARAQSMNEIRP
jgi:hypothetical protein